MGDFFKSGRRIAGFVTLVLAFAFMMGWLRSRSMYDFVDIPVHGSCYRLTSRVNEFGIIIITPFTGGIAWKSGTLSSIPHWFGKNGELIRRKYDIEWQFQFGDFVIVSSVDPDAELQLQKCIVSYRIVAIPLTLISAWLLLSKPRSPKAAAPPPATSDEPNGKHSSLPTGGAP